LRADFGHWRKEWAADAVVTPIACARFVVRLWTTLSLNRVK